MDELNFGSSDPCRCRPHSRCTPIAEFATSKTTVISHLIHLMTDLARAFCEPLTPSMSTSFNVVLLLFWNPLTRQWPSGPSSMTIYNVSALQAEDMLTRQASTPTKSPVHGMFPTSTLQVPNFHSAVVTGLLSWHTSVQPYLAIRTKIFWSSFLTDKAPKRLLPLCLALRHQSKNNEQLTNNASSLSWPQLVGARNTMSRFHDKDCEAELLATYSRWARAVTC